MDGSLRTALGTAAGVTAAVAAAAWWLPPAMASNTVAVIFFATTYWLVLRRDPETVRAHGVSLGGLLEPSAIQWRATLMRGLNAARWCGLMMLLTFPLYWVGWLWWWKPDGEFSANWGAAPLDEVVGQVFAIALPEELFYRGYLQSTLDRHWPGRWRILGASVGVGLLLSCAIFALGHLATVPNPARLSVFFPALLFGWLRAKTGGIGAAVLFHAACNLLSTFLARSYGLL